MPGVIGGLVSAIVASRGQINFGSGDNFNNIFLAPGRTASTNAGYQLASLALTLGIAIVGGLFTGWLTSRSFFEPVPVLSFFDDQYHWDSCQIEHQQLKELKNEITTIQKQQTLNNSGKYENPKRPEDDDVPEEQHSLNH